jgi:hypothetical protein
VPLSEKEFATLVRSMPGASEDEIIAAAKAREAGPSKLRQAWDAANQPLVDLPDLAPAGPNASTLERMARGAAGFLGTVAEGMTSPVGLASLALSGGASAAGRAGLLGISRGARAAEAALNVPVVAEGAYNIKEGAKEGDAATAAVGALQAGLGGLGIRSAAKHSFPVDKVADAYRASKGLPKGSPPALASLNTDFSKRVADAFEALQHNPNDPATQAAYKQLAQEVSDQYRFVTERAGVKIAPGEAYPSSKAMAEDVVQRNQLRFTPSEEAFGDGGIVDNPLLAPGASGRPVNDELRAIHDYFGHAQRGYQFGPLGEENAFREHASMFTPGARQALATETRGQNSWVNFGPHLRQTDGSLPAKGEPGFIPAPERPFAQQKTGLLPEELTGLETGAPTVPPRPPALQLLQDERGAIGNLPLEQVRPMLDPNVPLDKMRAQERRYLDGLKDKVATQGIQRPLRVVDFNGRPLLEDGHHRFAVAEELGLKELPVDMPDSLGGKLDPRYAIDLNADLPGFSVVDDITENASGESAASAEALSRQAGMKARGEQFAVQKGGQTRPLIGPDAVDYTPRKGETYGVIRDGRFSPLSTASAVVAPAASQAIGEDGLVSTGDPETDAALRAGLNILGAAGGAASLMKLSSFPKRLGNELDQLAKQVEKDTGGKKAAVVKAVTQVIRERVPDPKQAKRLVNQYFAKEVPDYDGVPFSQRKPIGATLRKAKGGGTEFTDWSRQRLDKAYEVGNSVAANWGDPSYLGKMVNGNVEDGVLLTRLLGALSPGTPTQANALQALETFVRVKRGEDPAQVITAMKSLGVINQTSKIPNLQRAVQGGRLFQQKVESLAANEFGVSEDVPVDLWLLRAIGSETERTPPKGLYDAINDAMRREAAAKGEEFFPYMAKVWGGTQRIAGRPTPSFSEAFEKMNLPGPITDPQVQDWILENAQLLRQRIQKRYEPTLFDQMQPTLGEFQPFDPAAFKQQGQQRILEGRAKGDVLKAR